MSLVVTGSPGTGKHTAARALAKRLRHESIDLNLEAERLGAAERRDGETHVDTDALRQALGRRLGAEALVVGHLAPYVLTAAQVRMAIVLRRDPRSLELVYRERGYSSDRALQNLQSEILGVVAHGALERFGRSRVTQIDVTDIAPSEVLKRAVAALGDGARSDPVDWLSLVLERGELRRYFAY